MSVEAAIGTGIGTAIGTSIGPRVGSAVDASIGASAEMGGMASLARGIGTAFSPEALSGGMSKSIGMDEIMRTTVPLSVDINSFNPDRVVPGEPRMVFDPRLFSVMAEPRSVLVDAPTRTDLYSAVPTEHNFVAQESVADKKFTAEMALQIAELFRDEPEAQSFWTTRVEKALESADPEPKQDAKPIVMDIYPPELDALATGVEPIMKTSPSTETEEEEATDTQIAVQTDSSDENAAPPSNVVIEKKEQPEESETPEDDDPDWNVYKLHKAWKTAKDSLKRRAEIGRSIVNRAFSEENLIPAEQIAAEAAILDIPDVFEIKEILAGDLKYPTVEYDVALSATAAGTSYAAADHAVQKVIHCKAPMEKHNVSVFEEQVKQSKLTGPVKQLAEEGAKAIVLRKRKEVWEATKKRIGIHPVELERAPKAVA